MTRLFAPHPCGSQSCHWRDRRQHPGHDVLGLAAPWGWGLREDPLRLLSKAFTRRQCAVDPAPPEALDSLNKPVARRPGSRSPGYGSCFRRLSGSSRHRTEAPRLRRSSLSGRNGASGLWGVVTNANSAREGSALDETSKRRSPAKGARRNPRRRRRSPVPHSGRVPVLTRRHCTRRSLGYIVYPSSRVVLLLEDSLYATEDERESCFDRLDGHHIRSYSDRLGL